MEDQPTVKRFSLFNYLIGRKEKKNVSEEAIIDIINQGSQEGIINDTSKEMIQGVLDFNDKLACEVMTSRIKVQAIDIEKSLSEITELVLDTNFSRLPVYEGDLHKIIGVLHVQDYLCYMHKHKEQDVKLKDLLIMPYIVPETKNLQKLFRELQTTQNHMAILLDEYGDFAGIVTMEDILEEIVGNIRDEYEQDETILEMEDGSYLVDGLVHIDELNRRLNFDIECEHFDTIGGFVVHLLGTIPKTNIDINVSYKELVFEVEGVKGNRVEKLRIYNPQSL